MCFLHHICLSLELLCHCKTSFSRTELSFLSQRCFYLDDSYKCFLLQSYLLPDKPWVARGFRRWKEETRLWWVIPVAFLIMFSKIWPWGYPKHILLNQLHYAWYYHRYQHNQWSDHRHLALRGACGSVAVSLFVDKSKLKWDEGACQGACGREGRFGRGGKTLCWVQPGDTIGNTNLSTLCYIAITTNIIIVKSGRSGCSGLRLRKLAKPECFSVSSHVNV